MLKHFPYLHIHLVGIKGVAMTSLAQILIDAGYQITGSDLPESFVTDEQLTKLDLAIQHGFENKLPEQTEAVVYTAAHGGSYNPQVQEARAKGIPAFSQAEALSFFFNSKQGIAVCGVGGKSTVSAMISWIIESNKRHPSFSVGVGNIIGLDRTGAWRPNGHQFVAEADEYVTDPISVQNGNSGIPRFSYLNPKVIVATSISFDHPDVYKNLQHTIDTFSGFFSKLTIDDTLVLTEQVLESGVRLPTSNKVIVGTSGAADYRYELVNAHSKAGTTVARLHTTQQTYTVTLKLPGEYNIQNAVCAIAACSAIGVSNSKSIAALKDFRSTSRRFEQKQEFQGVTFYDDYAHHPRELTAVIQALKNWYPSNPTIIVFQPHTFSRTKALLNDFAQSLSTAEQLILLDIFPSARESIDPTISSTDLARAIEQLNPHLSVPVLATVPELAHYLKTKVRPGTIVLTAGAGDVYSVYDLLR